MLRASGAGEPNILFEIDKAKTPKQIILKTEQAGLHATLSLSAITAHWTMTISTLLSIRSFGVWPRSTVKR
jgi:hypothetical protein